MSEEFSNNVSEELEYFGEDSQGAIENQEFLKNNLLELANRMQKSEADIENIAQQAKVAIEQAEKSSQKAKKAGREAKKLKRELVVILGILATILIGSVGTMVYSASVFSGLKDMPATKLMFGILLVGSLFIVVFGMMFSFLREMCGDDDVASEVSSEVKNAGFSAKKPNLFSWAFFGVWHWILTFFTAVVVVSVAYLLTNCFSNLLPKIFHEESLKTIKTIKTEPQNFSQNQNFTQNTTFAK